MPTPRHAYATIFFAALLTAKASSFAPANSIGSLRQRRPQTCYSVQRAPLPSSVEGRKKLELTTDQRDEIDGLVAQRADARRCGDYNLADSIRAEIEACTERFVAPGYQIELKDIPRKDGGGSTWDVVPQLRESIERSETGQSVLQLSHIALGLAIASAEQDVALDLQVLEDIVTKALARLEATGAAELRGRKAADAAFWFALSGASSPKSAKLFDSLTHIAIEELERFGNKSSCRAKDIMHIVERLYATGLTGDLSKRLSDVAAKCLSDKEFRGRNTSTNEGIIDLLQRHEFDLHCDRPLLWLWRFSIRQKKQRSFLRGATEQYERYNHDSGEIVSSVKESTSERTEYNWSELFADPSNPLVIDIGCGYGVSLHGLATLQEKDLTVSTTTEELDIEWGQCNFLGVDLSRTAIGFGNALSLRWGIQGKLAYVVGSAEDVLQAVQRTYPGSVCLAMIQFPTPFKLQKVSVENENEKEAKGNSQLPKHPYSDFMVTNNLLQIARETLSSRGKLIMQSNVEDVAVYMRDIAESGGFSALAVSNPITSFDQIKARVPQRTKEYAETGGKRALGEGWARDALLPRRGATETEVACLLETTPVHRFVLIPRDYTRDK